jgi:hypothetical protein
MAERGDSSNGKAYEVGYAKPPKSAQFEKGTSGNPKGRPKGAKSIGATLAKMGRQRIKITSNGQTRMVTMLEAMVMQLINQAAGGNLKAIREMLAAHRLFVEPEQATNPVSSTTTASAPFGACGRRDSICSMSTGHS